MPLPPCFRCAARFAAACLIAGAGAFPAAADVGPLALVKDIAAGPAGGAPQFPVAVGNGVAGSLASPGRIWQSASPECVFPR